MTLDGGTRRVPGVVKWFDSTRGFGFVVSDEGGPDILLHANVLRNFGQSSIADGARIVISVQHTERGVQAAEVLEVEAPKGLASPMLSDVQELTDGALKAIPLQPARVKWFDKAKGFGFANIFGLGDDIFIHVEVVRASGFADLAPGEAVALRVINGTRGRMAADIRAWETAAKGE